MFWFSGGTRRKYREEIGEAVILNELKQTNALN